MPRILILLALSLNIAAPAFAYNAAPGGLFDLLPVRTATDARFVFTAGPVCITRIFAVGEAPAIASQIEQITCLDAMCTLREIVICGDNN